MPVEARHLELVNKATLIVAKQRQTTGNVRCCFTAKSLSLRATCGITRITSDQIPRLSRLVTV